MANYYPTRSAVGAQDFRGARPAPKPAPRPRPKPAPRPRPKRRPDPRRQPSRPAPKRAPRPAPRVPFRPPERTPHSFGKMRYLVPASNLSAFQRHALRTALRIPGATPFGWLYLILPLMDLTGPQGYSGEEVPSMPGWDVYWNCGSGGTMLDAIGSPSGCGFFAFQPPREIVGEPYRNGAYFYAPYYAYNSPHPTSPLDRYLQGICYRTLANQYGSPLVWPVGEPFPTPALIPALTPIPMLPPIVMPTELPIVEPAPAPVPSPGVTVKPKRELVHHLNPWTPPAIQPEVGPAPVIVPPPGVVITVPDPVIHPAPPVVKPLPSPSEPPPRGTKEKKVRGGLPPGLVAGILNGLTEALDVINALWEALPKSIQWKDKLAAWKQGKQFPTALDKALSIYNNLDAMDWDKAADNLIGEHAEDSVYGRIGKAQAKVNAKLNTPQGPSVRPMWDAINALERSL